MNDRNSAALCRDAATGVNASENLIIEGDNLEVLKLLQGGYHGRVKMIYIDPPYNTGGEFIYPDNYKEGLADYLKFSGQVSGEGIKLTTNAETDGRYHSKWLTMMYPRLFLARNLLREDGVIFVSIDDHEVHNLRAVMNEIFGEENFIEIFHLEKSPRRCARRTVRRRASRVSVCYLQEAGNRWTSFGCLQKRMQSSVITDTLTMNQFRLVKRALRLKPLNCDETGSASEPCLIPESRHADGTRVCPKKQWWRTKNGWDEH